MAEDWSREENEAAVADYFDMLAKDLSGIPYSKAEHRRRLQKVVIRANGSIEYKRRNITAVLNELRFASIPGYKASSNYQGLLRVVVVQRLTTAKELHSLAENAVEKPFETPPVVRDILSIVVSPPVPKKKSSRLREIPRTVRKPLQRNYLEIEARNRSLGLAGEIFVLNFEHERLWRAGKRGYANRIEHVARTQGDSLGYDIRSFEKTGEDRLIEVKTTRFGPLTPFFASSNEVSISETLERNYQLYRLFQFSKQPRLFILPGSLQDSCSLEPSQFTATLKPRDK